MSKLKYGNDFCIEDNRCEKSFENDKDIIQKLSEIANNSELSVEERTEASKQLVEIQARNSKERTEDAKFKYGIVALVVAIFGTALGIGAYADYKDGLEESDSPELEDQEQAS